MRARSMLALSLLALILGLVGLALWWRAAGPGEPEIPPRFATSSAPEPALSTAQIPVTLSRAALRSLLEQAVPQVFLDERGRELAADLTLNVAVSRAGALTITDQQGALQITVPVETHLEVTPTWGKTPIEVNASLDLTVTSRLAISDDWRLQSKSTIKYKWTKEPKLSFARVDLPLKRVLDARLAEQLPALAAQVDQRLAERDPLRPKIQAAWEALHAPIDLGERAPEAAALPGGEAWLKVRPEALLAGDPVFDEAGLHLDVGLRGRFSLLVGAEPEAAPIRPLPPRQAPDPEDRLKLQIPVSLDWSALSALATARLAAQPERFDVPGAGVQLAVSVSSVTLYPSGDRVVAALDYALDGPSTPLDGRGRLYLSGVPEVDAAAATVRLRDLKAAVQTDVAAVAAAAWLGESGALEALEQRLIVPLSEPLDAARAQITAGLSRAREGKTRLSGALDRLSVEAAVPTEAALIVVIRAEGALSVTLTALEGERVSKPAQQGLPARPRGDEEKKPRRPLRDRR